MSDEEIELRCIEGFLKRAAKHEQPFMYKGSIITRQYLPSPEMRRIADLDCVYLERLDEYAEPAKIFSEWVTEVTEARMDDQIEFRSFKLNDFWREIDYAMSDDFPTVNTDLLCFINGIENDRFGLDISFNLDIDYPPEELMYKSIDGETFLLKYTCPYAYQVSWKLHQTLVRPRLKDFFDLIHLLNHERFSPEEFRKIVMALKRECWRDKMNPKRLALFLEKKAISKPSPPPTMEMVEEKSFFDRLIGLFKPDIPELPKEKKIVGDPLGISYISIEDYKYFTSKEYFPYETLDDLLLTFKELLISKGFTESYIKTW